MASTRKFSSSQVMAVGYVFGACNLALTTEAALYKIVKRYAKDDVDQVHWYKVVSSIQTVLRQFCDSDIMYREMLDECSDWVKQAEAHDEFVVDSWERDCKRYEVPEKHIFAGEGE